MNQAISYTVLDEPSIDSIAKSTCGGQVSMGHKPSTAFNLHVGPVRYDPSPQVPGKNRPHVEIMVSFHINEVRASGDKFPQGIQDYPILFLIGVPPESKPEFKEIPKDEKVVEGPGKGLEKPREPSLEPFFFWKNMGITQKKAMPQRPTPSYLNPAWCIFSGSYTFRVSTNTGDCMRVFNSTRSRLRN